MSGGMRPDGREIETRDLNVLTRGMERLVPHAVARRAVTISVETGRRRYDVGEPVGITVRISNRIPFPIEVVTAGRRIWGWRVDGLLEASDERIHETTEPRRFSMQARETKTIQFEWDCRFKRQGSPTRWERAARGEHEIEVFLATDPVKSDSAAIELQ